MSTTETSRQDIIAEYIATFSEKDIRGASHIAKQIQSDRPLAKTAVIIPVAAHQEAPQIANAIAQYGRQETQQPFSIVLGLNAPSSHKDDPAIIETVKEIEKAKTANDHLDIRTSFIDYKVPGIGRVRRDLWNAVMVTALEQGSFDASEDFIGVNHDIDLISFARTGIAKIQHYYELRQNALDVPLSPPVGTKVKHAHSPDHPNISKAVLWADFWLRAAGHSYEAGTVIPMSFYALQKGFKGSAKTGEVLGLLSIFGNSEIIKGTNAVTSIRRYLSGIGEDGYAIWKDEKFGAMDECRQHDDYDDISADRLHGLVDAELERAAGFMIKAACGEADKRFWDLNRRGVDEETLQGITNTALSEAKRLRRASQFMLDRVIGFPDLAEKFATVFSNDFAKKHIEKQLQFYHKIDQLKAS